MIEQRYGEDVRPWPEHGYFTSCRTVLSHIIAQNGFYYLAVWRDDDEAFWRWEVLCFSYHYDGDVYEPRHTGMAATRVFAERDGQLCLAVTQRALERACES